MFLRPSTPCLQLYVRRLCRPSISNSHNPSSIRHSSSNNLIDHETVTMNHSESDFSKATIPDPEGENSTQRTKKFHTFKVQRYAGLQQDLKSVQKNCINEFKTTLEKVRGNVSGKSFVNQLKRIPEPLEEPLFHNLSKQTLETIIPKVVKHSHFSNTANLFLLEEMSNLIRVNDLVTITTIAKALVNKRKVPKGSLKTHNDEILAAEVIPDRILSQYYRLILEYAVKSGQYEFGYQLAMDNHKYLSKHRNVLLELIDILLIKNPLQEEIQLFMVNSIRDSYDLKFTENQANIIFEKIPQNSSGFLDKKVTTSVMANLQNDNTDIILNAGYRSILKDAQRNNPGGCHETWLKIKHHRTHIDQHDHKVLAALIKSFTRNRHFRSVAKDIVNELPKSSYSDPLLTSPLIHLSVKLNVPELANAVCATIKPPVTRALLSDLLLLHLSFDDTDGTERVLQEINRIGSELVAEDYAAIVSQLLARKKVDAALKITQGIPLAHAYTPYTILINHYVKQSIKANEKLQPTKLAIIDSLIGNMVNHSGTPRRFWDRLAPIYIKYLVSSDLQKDLQIVKQIYINTFLDFEAKEYLDNGPDIKPKYDLSEVQYTDNPFMTELDDEKGVIYLRATENAKVIILKIIADAAIKIENTDVLNFALMQLKEAGLTRNEVMVDFSRKYQMKVAAKGFNPRKLRSYELSEVDRRNDILQNDVGKMGFIGKHKYFKLKKPALPE